MAQFFKKYFPDINYVSRDMEKLTNIMFVMLVNL